MQGSTGTWSDKEDKAIDEEDDQEEDDEQEWVHTFSYS